MKILLWFGALLLTLVLGLWGWRKYIAWINRDNARDADERAANIEAQAKGEQAIASYPAILPPAASWVRMNGGVIDLNTIGGCVPPLYTLPEFNFTLPNG
jgi:hypothetical protein